jgi:plastocyanin
VRALRPSTILAGVSLAIVMLVTGCAPSAADPMASFSGASLTITARGLAFDPDIITMPADQPLRLVLDNQDAGVPHDLHVFRGDTDYGTTPSVIGPGLTAIVLPPLAAGRYQFECTIHPNMVGEIVVQPGAVPGPSVSPDDPEAPSDSAAPSGAAAP